MNKDSLLFHSLVFYGNNLQHRGNWRILNQLRRWTNADINEEIEVERRGRRWVLNPSDFVHQDVFWSGYKDYWDLWHLERLLPVDAVILDVGSNFGYYAIELALALGPEARAIAFEPFPTNFDRLKQNIQLNDLGNQITPLSIALSNENRVSTMSLRSGKNNTGSAQVGIEGVDVELAALDDIWPSLKLGRLDMMKIDVEGHEVNVLNGGRSIIEEHRPCLLVELDPPRLEESGSSSTELIDLLNSLNYKLYESKRRGLVALTSKVDNNMRNILCIHNSRVI